MNFNSVHRIPKLNLAIPLLLKLSCQGQTDLRPSKGKIITSLLPANFPLEAFETLKKSLISAPIVQPPDWNLPFEIMCDASDYAVGAVLGQRVDKKLNVIHYASKTLDSAQRNYATTKK